MQENVLSANTQNNYFLNITLQEQRETLERLGLPVPVIESTREEEYATLKKKPVSLRTSRRLLSRSCTAISTWRMPTTISGTTAS